ncbi:MAG: hypothetical protein QM756_31790 [Polyangiaceae bacterium]
MNIVELEFTPLNVALREPFGIATGAQTVAANVLVELRLSSGVSGIGEAAPFPAVNGETQAAVLARAEEARRALVGLDARRYRHVAHAARDALSDVPSARAAIEMALLDALCRSQRSSLWSFFGGAQRELVSDITIPTGDAAHARQSATSARDAGFTQLKVKVGGAPLDVDLQRLGAIHDAAPNADLISGRQRQPER